MCENKIEFENPIRKAQFIAQAHLAVIKQNLLIRAQNMTLTERL